MGRAHGLAGRHLSWIAEELGVRVPADLRTKKGWIGQMVEIALGASAASRAEPDFPHLGVELKTLPVDATGKPQQSTYVCTARLDNMPAQWADSHVRHKLQTVLWLPIVGTGDLAGRLIGAPLLWAMGGEPEATLRADWEELSERIRLGQLDQLDARAGEALQLRPKAATNRDTTRVLDADGEWVETNPRGFYLRPSFTAALLRRGMHLPG